MVFYFSAFSEFKDRAFFLLGTFLVCFVSAGLGIVFVYFVLLTPVLSVGAGLGNRATQVWHRTRFRSCRLGLGGSWRIPCYFSSRPTDLPPLGSWGRSLSNQEHLLGNRTASFFVSSFRFPVGTFSPYPIAGGMAMAFVDDLFLPLKARPSVLYIFDVPCRLHFLAVQRCGSGFREPQLRLVF